MTHPLITKQRHDTMHEKSTIVTFKVECEKGGWLFGSRDVLCHFCPVCGEILIYEKELTEIYRSKIGGDNEDATSSNTRQ